METVDTKEESCATDELATIGYTGGHTTVIATLDISEVPDEDNDIIQIED